MSGSSLQGGDFIRDALGSCGDPLEVIADFQRDNRLESNILETVLPLLDLHGVLRSDIYDGIFDQLLEKLESVIPSLPEDRLLQLLDASFPFADGPLRRVVLRLLEAIPDLPPRVLSAVVENSQLYEACPVVVKRQVWEESVGLFGDEVRPLLDRYVEEKEALLLRIEDSPSTNFFTPSPKTRRQHEIIQTLASYIGRSVKLYNNVLQFLRALFVDSGCAHFCTLRADVLMALHDAEVTAIREADPCHKFVWCLDACIREKFIDGKRGRELKLFLDGITPPREQMRGDISMLLCDPFAVHTVASTIVKLLHQLCENEQLPRESSQLMLLLRLLQFGLNAQEMIHCQDFSEKEMDSLFVKTFLPLLVELLVNNSISLLSNISAQSDEGNHLNQLFVPLLRQDVLAKVIACQFTVKAIRDRDKYLIVTLLPALAAGCKASDLRDEFLHQLILALDQMGEEMAGNQEMLYAVFECFLLKFVEEDKILHFTHHLISRLHHRVDFSAHIGTLLEAFKPQEEHSERTHEFYYHVVDQVNTPRKERSLLSVPPPSVESSGSPLLDMLPAKSPLV